MVFHQTIDYSLFNSVWGAYNNWIQSTEQRHSCGSTFKRRDWGQGMRFRAALILLNCIYKSKIRSFPPPSIDLLRFIGKDTNVFWISRHEQLQGAVHTKSSHKIELFISILLPYCLQTIISWWTFRYTDKLFIKYLKKTVVHLSNGDVNGFWPESLSSS